MLIINKSLKHLSVVETLNPFKNLITFEFLLIELTLFEQSLTLAMLLIEKRFQGSHLLRSFGDPLIEYAVLSILMMSCITDSGTYCFLRKVVHYFAPVT